MNNLNSVLIEGNMVRDPLFRATQKGTSICSFTIASNRFYRQGQDAALEKEVGFFDVETWGKLAEACNSKGRKGRGVRVVGRLKQGRWTGTDGKNHSKIAIVAEHVEYHTDFKKVDETASEANTPADETAALINEARDDYPGISSAEGVVMEEFQAVVF